MTGRFGLESALKNWLGEKPQEPGSPPAAEDFDDEIPF
jgi:hypothetical protein